MKYENLKQTLFPYILSFFLIITCHYTFGQKFGTLKQQVNKIINSRYKIQVWQIRPDYTKNATYQVSIKHAAAGEKGSFYYTAWADTNNDGKPDKEIDRSELITADTKGEWSTWSFNSDYKKVFTGNMWNHSDKLVYNQEGGLLYGYKGLSNSVYYSTEFSGIPNNLKGPSYTNIKITAICNIINEIGITTEEVTNIENVNHQVQVWMLDPEFTIPGTYKIKVKHAYSGTEGSFYIVAWTDTDMDGIPDLKIAESDLNVADETGQWSSYEFNSEYENIYIGTSWEHKKNKTYYRIEQSLKGYSGLSNIMYYSKDFKGIPTQTAIPRYINIKVEIYN